MNKRGLVNGADGSRTVSVSAKTPFTFLGKIFGIFLKVMGFILAIGVLFLIGIIVFRSVSTGQSDVAIAHLEASSQAPKEGIESLFYGVSPDAYAFLFGGGVIQSNYETEVENNEQNRDLGVRITKFSPLKPVYLEGETLTFSGTFQAKSVADSMLLEAYCDTDGLEIPVEARILGTNAQGKQVVIPKQIDSSPVVYNVQCEIPTAGLALSKDREGRKVDLILVYEFATRATQKVYFMNHETYASLVNRGINPFDYYNIKDSQLSSDNKLRTKSTSAPLAIALGIDVPQPLTDSVGTSSTYQLTAGLEPNVGWTGNLERLESFEIQVPSVRDLDVVFEGDSAFSATGSSACGFDFTGIGEEGFKVYRLNDQRIAEINKDCSKRSLRGLALSESDCIDLFKSRPTFLCNFKATRVPENGLQYDTFRAEAKYIYKTTKAGAVELRKRPVGLV